MRRISINIYGRLVVVIGAIVLLKTATLEAEEPQSIRAAANVAGEVVTEKSASAEVSMHELPPQSLDEPRSIRSSDPQLEPGFPVRTFHTSGSYHAGATIHSLVGNIDSDPELEIIVTALAAGPLYAFNHDGSEVFGFPVSGPNLNDGEAIPVLGRLSAAVPLGEQQIFASFSCGGPGSCRDSLVALDGTGSLLPGWPRESSNYVATPAALFNLGNDSDGLDEIFIEEEDRKLHAYHSDGKVLDGWPTPFASDGGQERHTPAIADLDGDGDVEIVTISGWTSSADGLQVFLYAYHHDAQLVDNFPIAIQTYAMPDGFPVIGDIDDDGSPEIIVVSKPSLDYAAVSAYSAAGVLEWTATLPGSFSYSTAPALADFNLDGFPEIVVQGEDFLSILDGSGGNYPGWPVVVPGNYWLGNSSPVVGDVDGDARMEIVVTLQQAGSGSNGMLYVYNDNGTLHPSFPKALPLGSGAVPAIADIDIDGRNEIIVTGSFWNGISGNYDKVWAYDLGGNEHGRIEWGQFGGNASHTGFYEKNDAPQFTQIEDSYTFNSAAGNTPSVYYVLASDANDDRLTFAIDEGPSGPEFSFETVLLGDFNEDGVVNFADLGIMRTHFFSQAGDAHFNPFVDLTGDGVINFGDLALLKNNFFTNQLGGRHAGRIVWAPTVDAIGVVNNIVITVEDERELSSLQAVQFIVE